MPSHASSKKEMKSQTGSQGTKLDLVEVLKVLTNVQFYGLNTEIAKFT